jgi:hypothetical protein
MRKFKNPRSLRIEHMRKVEHEHYFIVKITESTNKSHKQKIKPLQDD